MLKLKDLFKTTKFGVQDARQIANKSKEFIEAKYGIKVNVKKESENQWYGGSVTGGKTRSITLLINTKERFDLLDFMNELNECEFIYEENQGKNVWVSSIQNYLIVVEVNENEVDFNKIIGGVKVTEEMVLRHVFGDENYVNMLSDYFKKDENNKWVLK
ncbi:MAG: hypothetical protein RBR97_19170 [Bacteroidales bacterium]|nr:hypothetical protein [Bacteroidales bacterium]